MYFFFSTFKSRDHQNADRSSVQGGCMKSGVEPRPAKNAKSNAKRNGTKTAAPPFVPQSSGALAPPISVRGNGQSVPVQASRRLPEAPIVPTNPRAQRGRDGGYNDGPD